MSRGGGFIPLPTNICFDTVTLRVTEACLSTPPPPSSPLCLALFLFNHLPGGGRGGTIHDILNSCISHTNSQTPVGFIGRSAPRVEYSLHSAARPHRELVAMSHPMVCQCDLVRLPAGKLQQAYIYIYIPIYSNLCRQSTLVSTVRYLHSNTFTYVHSTGYVHTARSIYTSIL